MVVKWVTSAVVKWVSSALVKWVPSPHLLHDISGAYAPPILVVVVVVVVKWSHGVGTPSSMLQQLLPNSFNFDIDNLYMV